jgi:hypothetical protein
VDWQKQPGENRFCFHKVNPRCDTSLISDTVGFGSMRLGRTPTARGLHS